MAEQLVFNFDEVWKPIPGYEGFNEASDQGRIRSVDRQLWCSNGWRHWTGRILRPATANSYGHKCVVIGRGDYWLVHQLVALTFIGPCPDGKQVCHNNSIPSDNRLINLRYDTPKGNSADAVNRGSFSRGTRHWRAKLTERNVLAIRASSESPRILAKRYGVISRYIWEIRTRKTWAWVTGDVEDSSEPNKSNGVGARNCG